MQQTWMERDLPVLDAAVAMLEDNPMVTDAAITDRTGFDLAAVKRAMEALDGAYVHLGRDMSGFFVDAVTAEARRAVGPGSGRLARAWSASSPKGSPPPPLRKGGGPGAGPTGIRRKPAIGRLDRWSAVCGKAVDGGPGVGGGGQAVAAGGLGPGVSHELGDQDQALEEQRSEKYRHALIAVVSIGVRAGQLGGTDAWLSSHLISHA